MKLSLRNHIFFWLAYLVWDVLQAVVSLSATPSWPTLSIQLNISLYASLLGVAAKIILFYLLYYFSLAPLLAKKIKGIRAVSILVAAVALLLLLQRVVVFYIILPFIYTMDMEKMRFFNISGLVFTLFDLLIPVCVLLIYELYSFIKQSREKEAIMQKEKLASELNFLKAQINPHFLFNVLSTVHALSLNNAPEAADVTMKLSQLMRFMLFDAKRKTINLAEEIKILEDYIELEKIRFSNKLSVRFVKKIDDYAQRIAPLILLPFVENAFKHGSGESRFNSFVNISLIVTKGQLDFTVENSFEESAQNGIGMHIGLANIKRQLELIYPQHKLTIEKKGKFFFVTLRINLASDEKI